VQNILNSTLKPSPGLIPDGIFGPKTEAAVETFQRETGLNVDGIVGPRTWAMLEPGAIDVDHGIRAPATAGADNPWMAIAQKEVGQSELPGARHNQRIIQYHATTGLQAKTDEIAWCSSFVNWCLRQARIGGTNSAAAISWLSWGRPTHARQGAVAVIHNPAARNTRLSRSGNHVGFLVQESPTHFILLGGNQSDQVRVSRYPKSRWQLKGYRWPS
jgi:uncharacterized protein (TIGR02594 family)